MYKAGMGVPQDNEKALHFFQQSASHGHKKAQEEYGKLLR